jgi:hypothetical protein
MIVIIIDLTGIFSVGFVFLGLAGKMWRRTRCDSPAAEHTG